MTAIIGLLALGDAFALALAGTVAWLVRTEVFPAVDPYLRNPGEYLRLLAIAIGLWWMLMVWRGGYRRTALRFRLDEMMVHFQASLVLLVLTMAATFIYHGYAYSRIVVGTTWLLFVLMGSGIRGWCRAMRRRLFARGIGVSAALLAGSGRKRELFERRIAADPDLGIRPRGLPAGADLEATLAAEPFDELFLFDGTVPYERLWALRLGSRNPAIEIHLIPELTNFYARHLGSTFFDGALALTLDSPANRRWTLLAKRAIDAVVAAVFLVLLAPLLALLALLIKLDSTGPVLFRQQRIGQGGRPFTILKLRTMHVEVDAYAVTPTEASDPRITRLGRLLRATGLDELPQLVNVLRGDMSLVGPRPEMPFIVESYSELERRRLEIRPGITGLWQIYARTSREPIHSHIEYDLYYLENVSLAMDLMILLDTLPTMVWATGV